jgi:hypothetical protein
VLPALAETGVLLRTQGDLFPGVTARRTEPAETAALKGRLVMTEVLATAVRDRQWVPDEPLEIELEQREILRLDPETCREARDRAHARPTAGLARTLFDVEIVRPRRPGRRADPNRPARQRLCWTRPTWRVRRELGGAAVRAVSTSSGRC